MNTFGKRRVGKRSPLRKPASKRTVAKKAVAKANKSNMVKLIKSVVKTDVEDKKAYLVSNNSNLTYFNSGINSTADMLQIFPNITQGTDSNNRIGREVIAKRLSIKGYVRLDSNTSFNDYALSQVVCRMMIVSLKSKPNYNDATSTSTPLGALLLKGGTTTNFTGVLSDINASINTDVWTVHSDRKFYLSQDALIQPSGAGATSQAIDTRNAIKFFNIPIRCRNKKLKYDYNISSGILPVNYGPILLLGYSFLNATSPDVVSARVGLHFETRFDYEDA